MDILKSILGIDAEFEAWDKSDQLPLYIVGNYEFQAAKLNGCRCILITPTDELCTLPALKKQIKRIQEIDNVPVVLRLRAVSSYRRKNMIENRVPFLTDKQAYLPFMGTYLEKEQEEPKEISKFMYSTQQLVLLYLYGKDQKLYVADATAKLPFTAMTMSRAVKQLEATHLFEITKEGVNKVIEAKHGRKELYRRLKKYMMTPVRMKGYIEKDALTEEMILAGESVLAEKTMLNPPMVSTYAVYAKQFKKESLMKELVDPYKQIELELWEYEPKRFAIDAMADALSVALSLSDTEDERIEEAVEEMTESIWGD